MTSKLPTIFALGLLFCWCKCKPCRNKRGLFTFLQNPLKVNIVKQFVFFSVFMNIPYNLELQSANDAKSNSVVG